MFFHELGHALSNVLDLPITGKEEDAVDQLSTFLLAEGDDDNEASALNGAYWFLLEAQQRGPIVKRLFADEHSLLILAIKPTNNVEVPLLVQGMLVRKKTLHKGTPLLRFQQKPVGSLEG